MTKAELRSLALVGYIAKLKHVEAQLADDYKTFPEAFIGNTAPQLVRPELRNGGGKHWPIEASKGKRESSKLTVAEQRSRTATLLAAIAAHGAPMDNDAILAAGFNLRSLPPLTRTGYLKRTKRGIVRTAKTFTIDKD